MKQKERSEAIERLREAGRKGGIATRRKHGKKHFKRAGSLGGKSRWKLE